MHSHNPKVLRKLAATYRARATTEPDKARTFLEIADDMEAHAQWIEEHGCVPRPMPFNSN